MITSATQSLEWDQRYQITHLSTVRCGECNPCCTCNSESSARYNLALVNHKCSTLTCALSVAASVSLVARAVVGARHVVTLL